jgi:hypothetical protein
VSKAGTNGLQVRPLFLLARAQSVQNPARQPAGFFNETCVISLVP